MRVGTLLLASEELHDSRLETVEISKNYFLLVIWFTLPMCPETILGENK